jgi:hypothetical protein
LKEVSIFLNDNDMQTATLSLKVASPTITIAPAASNESQEYISKAALLSKSGLI